METTPNASSPPALAKSLSKDGRGYPTWQEEPATNHRPIPQQVVLPHRTGLILSMLQQPKPQAQSPTLSHMHISCTQHSTHTPETPSCSHVSTCPASTLTVHPWDGTHSSPPLPWEHCMELTVTMEKKSQPSLFPGQCGDEMWDMNSSLLDSTKAKKKY